MLTPFAEFLLETSVRPELASGSREALLSLMEQRGLSAAERALVLQAASLDPVGSPTIKAYRKAEATTIKAYRKAETTTIKAYRKADVNTIRDYRQAGHAIIAAYRQA